MTNPLLLPPHTRLNLEICKLAYLEYQSKTATFFQLPLFEERFHGKLEGILGSVAQTYDGEYLFPTLSEAAAAYFVKISTQHPFRDGNKRMGVFFTDTFFTLNDLNLTLSYQYMYEFAKFIVAKKEAGDSGDFLQRFSQEIFEKAFEVK